MKRRRVLIGMAGYGIGMAVASSSTAQSRRPLIGLLDAGERLAWWSAFRKQMADLGYVEGRTVSYEARYARSRPGELPALVQDLLNQRVDLIVTAGTEASIAASRATESVPIVTATGGDHVSHGLANSLAQPGRNVTGMTSIASQLTAKRLALLREMFPKLLRLAVVWHSTNAGSVASVRDLEAATRASNISLHNVGVRRGEELPEAFTAAVQKGAQAVLVVLGALIYTERHAISALALKHRLPSMHGSAEMVEAGGLVSYGTSYPDLLRSAAFYVDKILKGAKPAVMPIEQPSKFELVVNLRTAKEIGFTTPQALLLRATRVID
jgi:putative tryptophan/tyrosine transport system substrate-binding protein